MGLHMTIYRGPCRDFLDEFSNFVDGTLDPGRRSLLLAHLDCCEACLRHLKAYREGIAAYRDANAPVPAWGLYERVVERLGGESSPARVGETSRGGTGAGRAGSRLGAVLAMAALAMLVLVPPTGLDLDLRTRPEGNPTPDAEAASTSWAGVIPIVLPVMTPAQARRPAITPSSSRYNYGSETVLRVEGLAEVPRRQVRMTRVNDFGISDAGAGGLAGWSPRRPPITIHRASHLAPATWIAEAALRIP